MKKLPAEHVRDQMVMIRVSEAEAILIKKLAKKSKAKTVSAYIRAAGLNRPDDGAVFRDILKEQIRLNAEIKAAPPGPLKEQAIAGAVAYMHRVMSQK